MLTSQTLFRLFRRLGRHRRTNINNINNEHKNLAAHIKDGSTLSDLAFIYLLTRK